MIVYVKNENIFSVFNTSMIILSAQHQHQIAEESLRLKIKSDH